MSRFQLGQPDENPVVVRVGKYGPFLEHGERTASLPDGMAPDELTMDVALDLLQNAEKEDEPLGVCPDTHKPVFLKQGPFWPLCATRLARRQRKTKERVAAERHGAC